MLICGAVVAMCACDLIAIIFGKVISKKIPERIIQKISGILFFIFGFFGILNFLFNFVD